MTETTGICAAWSATLTISSLSSALDSSIDGTSHFLMSVCAIQSRTAIIFLLPPVFLRLLALESTRSTHSQCHRDENLTTLTLTEREARHLRVHLIFCSTGHQPSSHTSAHFSFLQRKTLQLLPLLAPSAPNVPRSSKRRPP